MRQRHRIPSIFNLSMVDVLCCALGCVILLWLLNLRQAKQSGNELTTTQRLLADKTREAEDIYGKLRAAEARLVAVEADVAALRDKRMALESALARRGKDLADVRLRADDLAALLKKKEAEARDAAKSVQALQDRLRDSDQLAKKYLVRADSLDAKAARLERDLDARTRDLTGNSKKVDELDTLRVKLMRDLAARDRDLVAANQLLDRAREEKISLVKQTGRLRSEMESRFAGIALTGKNVVFLVDMSGSMELVDPQTSAPDKWQGVRETLTRVMRSLPGLQRFQVILFSDKVLYPFGKESEWLDYDGPASADRVLKMLADPKFKPKGGTNMYAAFEAAFRFRPAGLDTIYLLSDGLPNQGRGITAEQAASLPEIEKGELLGKYIRKTMASDWNKAAAGRRVRINAIGFFYESPDVGAFLWALARENDGSFVGMSKP